MRKNNTARKARKTPELRSNIIAFPVPEKPEEGDPYLAEIARAMEKGESDMNLLLTGGQVTGHTLHQLPEGLRLDGPDGQPLWRIFRVTD
jgi:hypothetical protein